METILDHPEQLEALDRGGMLKALREFPESCRDGVKVADELPLDTLSNRRFKAIAIVGIGGSAIGGQLLHDWLLDSTAIPLLVCRGSSLPAFIDEETLIFAVSYSGNTEETLTALGEALERKCPVVALTSGGRMQKLSAEKGLPVLPLPKGMQPRAALPNQFFSLANTMMRLGLASELRNEIDEAVEVLEALRDAIVPEVPTSRNLAKRTALGLKGMVPFVYGPQPLGAVAYRIRTQLNENGKVPAASGSFPEAFHNAVMGCEGPEEVRRSVCTLIIRDTAESPEIGRKTEGFKRLLESGGGRVLEIRARGNGKLARMFSALYVGDYASAYLGLLYGLDPSSMDSITALKRL
jgi:glucose/mannose-6-phosphate isomerase